MRVIAHGGAGGVPETPTARQTALDAAARAGTDAATPIAAVLACVRRLEADPRFNAGVGGAVQADGVIRTDAGLMTDDRRVGAVCAMPGVEHACEVARVVLTETPHVLVAGNQAVALAEAYDLTPTDLWSERTRERWADADAPPADAVGDQVTWVADRFGADDRPDTDSAPDGAADAETAAPSDPPPDRDHDTVGAVATDGDRIATCTSTGGRWGALAGRVGDVPQVGAGFYAGPAGGVSATGAGEDIARVTLSRLAVDALERGLSADAAAARALAEFEATTGATAGLIVLTPDGDAGATSNAEAMQTAVAGTP